MALDFTPCTPRHRHCSRWHAELVESYRLERRRQLEALEALCGGYSGDEQLWRAQGGELIDFHQWLKSHVTQHDSEMAA